MLKQDVANTHAHAPQSRNPGLQHLACAVYIYQCPLSSFLFHTMTSSCLQDLRTVDNISFHSIYAGRITESGAAGVSKASLPACIIFSSLELTTSRAIAIIAAIS